MVKEQLPSSQDAIHLFLGILNSGKAYGTLVQMLETGFLGAFVPEFGRVQDLVQFDTYHIRPVGMHTLETIRNLENLSREDSDGFGDMYARIEHPERLLLSAFFHDLGKGLGGGHSEKGAVGQINTRFQQVLLKMMMNLSQIVTNSETISRYPGIVQRLPVPDQAYASGASHVV